MKILQIIYEFYNKEQDTTCGLYYVETELGNKHYFIRNNKSVGAIQHYLGRPSSECVAIIRDDVKEKFFSLLTAK